MNRQMFLTVKLWDIYRRFYSKAIDRSSSRSEIEGTAAEDAVFRNGSVFCIIQL